MVKLLKLQNELDGFKQIPKVHNLTEVQKQIIKKVISRIPKRLREEIEKRLVGIMIVNELGMILQKALSLTTIQSISIAL